MDRWIDEAFEKAAVKFKKAAATAAAEGILPYRAEGTRLLPSPFDGNSWWTGGFWPGIMWQLFAATGDAAYREEALRAEKLLEAELMTFDRLNHDVGFMYLLSCGVHARLEGDAQARTSLLHAATLLAGRFNPAGFIRAWNDDRAGWAIIDCMMNLSLLYRASRETGDPRFAAIARIHADTSLREFVREDGSCNHIVIFDPVTGIALDKPGGQGYAPGSSWSRGQAWALYGFTISAAHTGETRYLETARRIARYFIANIRPDGLTDCDFRQPKDEERIDNIAGACAACGLLELSGLVTGDEREAFRGAAVRMIRALCETSANWSPDVPGILTKCTASYHDDGAGRHVNILYGDYFLVEALARLRGSDIRPWFSND